MKINKTRELVMMSFYIALFIVFEVVGNMVPFFKMPQGGSLGISTIPLLVASYHLGWKKGLTISFLSVLLQFITSVMYTPNLLGFLLDYIIAFTIYGIACIFPNYKWFYSGIVVVNVVRFLSNFLSGVLVWETTPIASLVYNAYYMVPTLVVGLILVPILIDVLKLQDKSVV